MLSISAVNYRSALQTLQIQRVTQSGAKDVTFAAKKSGNLLFAITEAERGEFNELQRFDMTVDSSNRLLLLIGKKLYLFAADGTVVASYKTTNLAGGSFSTTDNGVYALRILDGYVQDQSGAFVPKRTLGNLTVAIA